MNTLPLNKTVSLLKILSLMMVPLFAASCAASGHAVLDQASMGAAATDADPTADSDPDEPGRATSADSRRDSWTRLSFVTPRGEPMTLHIPSKSRSIGTPTSGSLVEGRDLGKSGPGFIQFGEASWGTDETVMLVMFAAGELLRDYPGSVPALIGSLSLPGGGPVPPHKSHQSGRDADIGFFARGNQPVGTFGELDPAQIDFQKSLTMLVNLISTGRVHFIFINYALQKFFYEAAVEMGYSEAQLDYLFQYPRGNDSKAGLIRHASGHFRHAHVRFACPVDNPECIN